jgi:hypothetical protein
LRCRRLFAQQPPAPGPRPGREDAMAILLGAPIGVITRNLPGRIGRFRAAGGRRRRHPGGRARPRRRGRSRRGPRS